VTASRHLTDEALMLYAGNRLPSDAAADVHVHLANCAECRSRLSNTRLAHAVLASLSDMGLEEVRQRSKESQRSASPTSVAFPLLPIGGIISAAAVIILMLFSPRVVTEVRASELLTRAVAAEQTVPESQTYQLRVGRTACATMHRGHQFSNVVSSDACSLVLGHMRHSAWAKENPLSAGSFRSWRSSLSHRHDKVAHKPSGWTIETRSDTGLVRLASLDLREPDLHPTALTLHFEDDAELSVSEDSSPSIAVPAAVAITRDQPSPTIRKDDLSDILEVRSWEALKNLDADSGWEANVLRSGSQVVVRAIVSDGSRKRELQAGLAQLDAAEIRIQTSDEITSPVDFLPQRAFPASGPALAEPWVKEHFADSDAQNTFKNNVAHQSRNLLGRALFIDRLQQRRSALASCSCVSELTRLIISEQAELRTQQTALISSLAPLLDIDSSSGLELVTAKTARQLDLIVQELLISSGDDADSLEKRKSTLRSLLSTPRNSSAPAA
jgi:hypothetical protein